MKIIVQIQVLLFLLLIPANAFAQESTGKVMSSFDYRGQLSAWSQFAPDIEQSLWFGGRYVPQINYEINFPTQHKIDFEISANIFGSIGIKPFSETDANGKIKPYRIWGRYSTQQMEIRLGLQKINFGSAQMFRPLMWFDSMDPRDPLQMTDGVWGGLFRYYFQNNTNIWFWTLYGNNQNKGWEFVPSSQSFPELGGRVQLPLKQGEVALSYHFRQTDFSDDIYSTLTSYEKIPENRIGFDIRLDRFIGLWFEGSWTHASKNLGEFTNQTMLTLGGDYTFGIGNGLGLTFEQLLYSYDEKAFAFQNATTFSGLTFTYPVTLFDNISTMFYYDWENNDFYSFLNWQHDFNHFSLYGMLYWNPKSMELPSQMGNERFFGKGVQIMFVWNH